MKTTNVLKLEAEKCLMHVLRLEGLLFRTLIPFAVMMCIAVSAVCICIFMFFYDSSAHWTKRPFRTVRHWQALPFTFTILLACIVRWAHQTAEMWFPLKPMYDFNLIQQPKKKKKRKKRKRQWAQESFIKYSFSINLLLFCFDKTILFFLVSFLPLSLPSSLTPLFPLHPSALWNPSCQAGSQSREMIAPVWAKPDHLLLFIGPEVNV